MAITTNLTQLSPIQSLDELSVRTGEFLDQIRLNQRGTFTCSFPGNSEASVNIEMNASILGAPQLPDLNVAYVFKNAERETQALKHTSTLQSGRRRTIADNLTIFTQHKLYMPITQITGRQSENDESKRQAVATGMTVEGQISRKVKEFMETNRALNILNNVS